MKKKIQLSLVLLTGIAFVGCSPAPTMYYFGDYSQTLYTLEKNQNDESILKHKQELETIVSKSDSIGLPVPPGIYAELGYIYLNSNDSKKAIMLFNKEAQLYPESKQLMDRLIQSAQSRENDETNKLSSVDSNNSASK